MSIERCIRDIIDETQTNLTREEVAQIIDMLIEYDIHPRNRQVFGPFSTEQGRVQAAIEGATPGRLMAARDMLIARARLVAAQQQANVIANATKRAERQITYADSRDPVLGIQAKLIGTNTPFLGSRDSTAALMEGNVHDLVGTFDRELKAAGLDRAFASRTLEREWARELHELNRTGGTPGITRSPQALQMAQIIQNLQRRGVEMVNREGAYIGSYDGYITRTSHSSHRLIAAGENQWVADARVYFDIDTIYPNRTTQHIEEQLRAQYKRIASGLHDSYDPEELDLIPNVPGQNLARKVSERRVIHFRDAEAWLQYMHRYSDMTPTQVVFTTAQKMARDAALMRIWGTNPKAAFEADFTLELQRARDSGNFPLITRLNEQRRQFNLWMSYLTGEANHVVNETWARVTQNVLSLQRVAKLGFLPFAQITDLASIAGELRYQGVGLVDRLTGGILQAYVRGVRGSEKRQVADLLNAYLEGEMSQYGMLIETNDPQLSGGFTGRLNQLQNWFFTYTGAAAMTNRARGSLMYMMSRHWGSMSGRSFNGLGAAEQRMMRAFSINEHEWNALAQATWTRGTEGNTYLTPRDAMTIPDAAIDRYAEVMGIGDYTQEVVTPGRPAESYSVPSGMVRDVQHARELMAVYERYVRGIIADADAEGGGYGVRYRQLAQANKFEALARYERGEDVLDVIDELRNRQARRQAGPATTTLTQDAVPEVTRQGDFVSSLDHAEFRTMMAQRLYSLYADRLNYGVLNPGVGERAFLYQGGAPGSVLGTVLRLVTQFKTFLVAQIRRTWGREIYGGQGALGAFSGLAQFVLSGTVLGIVSNALSQIFKGQDPTSQWEERPLTAIAAGFTRSGTASIMGDYLFGEHNRHGASLVGSLAGPTLGSFETFSKMYAASVRGEKASGHAINFARSITPLTNMFYTKMAMDYLVWNTLLEASSPGWSQRNERLLRQNQALRYLPTHAPIRAITGAKSFAPKEWRAF